LTDPVLDQIEFGLRQAAGLSKRALARGERCVGRRHDALRIVAAGARQDALYIGSPIRLSLVASA